MALGRKKSAPQKEAVPKVFIDLTNYDVPGDMTVLKVRTVKPRTSADMDLVSSAIASKSIVLIDMESFSGEKERFIDSVKAYARGASCQAQTLNSISVYVVPYEVEVKSLRSGGQ